jgi:hypothetical protein
VGLNETGGEGRDSNPRVALATATSKLAAALAIGDLSRISRYHSNCFRLHNTSVPVR